MQPMKETFIYYLSQIGRLAIASNGKAVTRLSFCPVKWCHFLPYEEDAVLQVARRQLDEYFKGERQIFDMPLLFVGTDFQKNVWQELLKIPYGATITYADLAARLGRPNAVRAVANANGANAISIFAPCHRVVGSNGTLGGYGGGIEAKRFLLGLEGCNCS